MTIRSTTIVACRRNGEVAIAGDGQVTVDQTILKTGARKVQRLADGKVVAGFAGAVADAMTLFDKFRGKLEESSGNLLRAAVELAKEWRTDKYLRELNALLIVADLEHLLLISGTGDVIQPDDDLLAIGSGGNYALSAGRALLRHTNLSARELVTEALRIASEVCVYTNDHITVEALPDLPSGVQSV